MSKRSVLVDRISKNTLSSKRMTNFYFLLSEFTFKAGVGMISLSGMWQLFPEETSPPTIFCKKTYNSGSTRVEKNTPEENGDMKQLSACCTSSGNNTVLVCLCDPSFQEYWRPQSPWCHFSEPMFSPIQLWKKLKQWQKKLPHMLRTLQ